MESQIRAVVTFESTAFNMTEAREYFLNPCCFGDDVAEWLIVELRKDGLETDEKPGQEDFGWYLNFEASGIGHTFVIGHRPDGKRQAGTWIGWLERRRGLIASILGGRKRGIQAMAVEEIHRILSRSPLIRDLQWHVQRDFNADRGERGASSPLTPA